MQRNVGTMDRIARGLAALALFACAVFAPLPLPMRIPLVGMGLYMLGTSAVARCLGYRLMGRSSCPVNPR